MFEDKTRLLERILLTFLFTLLAVLLIALVGLLGFLAFIFIQEGAFALSLVLLCVFLVTIIAAIIWRKV